MAGDMPKIEFCEFQEYEPKNNASTAKINTRRSDAEVGMVVAYQHNGRLEVDVGRALDWEIASVESVKIKYFQRTTERRLEKWPIEFWCSDRVCTFGKSLHLLSSNSKAQRAEAPPPTAAALMLTARLHHAPSTCPR